MKSQHTLAVRLVIGLLLGSLPLATWAAPPGGGGSPPTGKIQFLAGNSYYSMNTDGSSKQITSPVLSYYPLGAPPSARKYNGRRWYVIAHESGETIQRVDGTGNVVSSVPAVELYAYAWNGANWDVLQLTHICQDGLYHTIDPTRQLVQWSRDGQDSFVSMDVTGYDLDAQGRYIVTDSRPRYVIRVWVSGSTMEACAVTGVDPMIGVADIEIVATEPSATIDNYTQIFTAHSWSPDNRYLTITEHAAGDQLYVWDSQTATRTALIYSSFSDSGFHHQWSPDGSKIVLGVSNSVLLMNSDGTGLKILLSYSTSNGSYYYPYWSPDGQWIVYRKFNTTRSIARYPIAGGKEVVLTKDLNGVQQHPLGWGVE